MRRSHRFSSFAQVATISAVVVGLTLPVALAPSQAAAPPNAPAALGDKALSALAAAAKDPMRLRQTGTKVARVHVTWKATRKTTKYLVQAFADIRLKKLITEKRTKKSDAWIGGGDIEENQKLWIRVTTIDRPKKFKSAKIKVYTGTRAPAQPTGVSVRATSPSSIMASWNAASRATGYTVQIAPTPNAAPVVSQHVDAPATAHEITGLVPASYGLGNEFFVTVKADRMKREFATSRPVPASMPFPTPLSAPAFNVAVASYNVLGANYDDALGRSFWDRVGLLGQRIADMGAEIVAVQEAAWTLKQGYRERPVQALASAAGMTLALEPGSNLGCAVTSNHVLYNANVFALETCGEDNLTINPAYPCTATWVVLKHLASGQPMFVVSAHFTVGSGLNELRLAETNLLVSLMA
ncbi:MAG: fibronectin type III domain-containing protein, partial [Bifidobacteriaceae bacterium]|nr:fibronectin type III domain-containing protein [Bifidobacteriaceae bacterium]